MPTGFFLYRSPVGLMAATSDGTALVGLRFVGQPPAAAESVDVDDQLRCEVTGWLAAYFSGHCPTSMPRLSLRGTAFQQAVWQALLTIPYGSTVTYGQLAQRIGCRSAQAVGQAVGRNPIAIIVPCHRVVGSRGQLTGYAYGIDRKQKLLLMERYRPTTDGALALTRP